jgi:hypothetical protein
VPDSPASQKKEIPTMPKGIPNKPKQPAAAPAAGENSPASQKKEDGAPVPAAVVDTGTGTETLGDTVTGDGSGVAAAPIGGEPLKLDEKAFMAECARIEATSPKKAEKASIKFVNMVRDPELWPAPHTATVHPDEVENYRPGGWEEAE